MNDPPCRPRFTGAPSPDSAPQPASPADSQFQEPSGASVLQVTGTPNTTTGPQTAGTPFDSQLQKPTGASAPHVGGAANADTAPEAINSQLREPSSAAVPLLGSPPIQDFGTVPRRNQSDQGPSSPTEVVPSGTASETAFSV